MMRRLNVSRRELLAQSAALAAAGMVTAVRSARGLPVLVEVPGGRGRDEPPKGEIEHRVLGKTGMSVAVLGFGGAEIGYENADQATVEKLLNAAVDQGLNGIDTAECYVDSEELIGNAVSHRRKDFFLFTKCGHWVEEGKERGWGWSKEGVLRSVERSLKRLKVDAVDLVQLHSCGLEQLKKGECIEGLEQARKEGKTRFIGYSGDSQAAKFAIESGKFDTLQTSINVCDQEAIDLLLPLAREKNMGVIAKRPIANAVWRYDSSPSNGYHVEYWNRLQKLGLNLAKEPVKSDAGPEGAAGIALRFTLSQPGVHVAIVGTTKPQRWKQNAELTKAGPLAEAKVKEIREKWKSVAGEDWTGQT